MFIDIIVAKNDILLISETKLDNTFALSNFKIPVFSNPFWRDRSSHGSGILLVDMPCILLY